MYLNAHQVTYIITQFKGVTNNLATTACSHVPWVFDREDSENKIAEDVAMMKVVQDQDSAGCRLLQADIISSFNKKSVIHPFEQTISHYYNWITDEFLKIPAASRTDIGEG